MNDISRRPRIRRSPDQIQSLLAEYRSAGLSVRKFALSRNLSVCTLNNWLRRHRTTASKAPRWIEVHPPIGSLNSNEVASVRFADGLSLELRSGFPPAPVAELVRLLR